METLKICLCCLLPADKELKTPYSRRGALMYTDMLEDCFQIHLTLGGEYGICEVCMGRLRDASDFKLQVQRSQVELQRLQGALDVKDEELVDEPEIPCDDECDVFQRDPLVKSEMDDVTIKDNLVSGSVAPDPTPISSCDDLYNRRCLIDHNYVKTNDLSVQSETDIELPLCMCDGHRQTSPIISAPSARPVSARAREQLAAACSVRLECLRGEARASQTCLATSRRGPRRASTEYLPDDTGKVYKCDTCGIQFTDKSRLIKHTQAHVTRADKIFIAYVCECSRRFPSKTAFFKHKLECRKRAAKSVPKMKPYSYEIRKKMYTRERGLNHGGTQTKVFICDICGAQLGCIASLTTHINLIHRHARKIYRCEVCYKRFTYKTFLNHKNAHIERPYNCEECNRSFKIKTQLSRHKLIHTGEKPYICDECGKQYRLKSGLDIHKKIHSGIKPYCCEVCNKRFTLKCQLVRHRVIHTGEKPYSCEVCNVKFSFQSSFIIHNKRKHRKP